MRVIATVQDPLAVRASSPKGPARAAARRGIELTIAMAGAAADVCLPLPDGPLDGLRCVIQVPD